MKCKKSKIFQQRILSEFYFCHYFRNLTNVEEADLLDLPSENILLGDELEDTGLEKSGIQSSSSVTAAVRSHSKFGKVSILLLTKTEYLKLKIISAIQKKRIDEFESEVLKVLGKDEHDEFEKFCLSLAPKIRRLHEKNPMAAAQVQINLQQVLFDAEFKETL